MMDANMQLFTSQDINWWTGVMWVTCGLLWCFYQLFGLSFWRHPFTAEDPLVSKWCNATFLQICSVEETKSFASWMAWGWVHFSYCSFISCNKHTIQEVGLLMLLLHNVVSVIVLSSPRLVLCVLNITFKLFVTCMCRTLTSTAARSIEPTSRQKHFMAGLAVTWLQPVLLQGFSNVFMLLDISRWPILTRTQQ